MEALIGLSIAIVGLELVALVPQSVRVWRVKTTHGISAASKAISLLACGAWVVYGILRHDATQIIVNGAAIVAIATVLLAMTRYGSLSRRALTALAIGCCAILLAAWHVTGVIGIAVLASVVSIIGGVPQAVLAWRRPGGLGLSIASLTLSAVVAFSWTTYGLLRSDVAVVVTSIWALTLMTYVAVRTVTGRRAPKPTPATVHPIGAPASRDRELHHADQAGAERRAG